MGNSLVPPGPLPGGTITHKASSSLITIEQRDGRMIHSLSEREFTAEYPIRYQIGGRLMGRTYIVQIGDYFFESPASWFNRYGWDISPGYAAKTLIDFDRPLEEQCLFCHAGSSRASDPDGRRFKNTNLTSITCDRCHGDTAAHLRHPSAKNIVNPARLPAALRDSVCEQCHLEGATRVLNPGKNWSDFHPGERTEESFTTYLLAGASNGDVKAVSHFEQLARSQCARASGAKLWCGTCHDPHGERSSDRAREVRAVCLSCHSALSSAAHPAPPQECTSCHMPAKNTADIAHAAITDHRILRRPPEAPDAPGEARKIVAWREPPAGVRDRDIGLAEVVVGFSKKLPEIGAAGFQTLQRLPADQQNQDPAILAALAGLALQRQNTAEALQLERNAAGLQPRSAKAALNLGIVLRRSGNLTEAQQQFERAAGLDPSLKEAFIELAMFYADQRRADEVRATVDRYLQWNPQDIMFRLQKAHLAAGVP